MGPRDLGTAWRLKAEELRQLGAEPQARALEWCAGELEAARRDWGQEALPLQQAVAESGYSANHLGRLLRGATIPNAGTKHAPRIRRSHLPRKACHARRNGRTGVYDLASFEQVARSVVNSGNGGHDG